MLSRKTDCGGWEKVNRDLPLVKPTRVDDALKLDGKGNGHWRVVVERRRRMKEERRSCCQLWKVELRRKRISRLRDCDVPSRRRRDPYLVGHLSAISRVQGKS